MDKTKIIKTIIYLLGAIATAIGILFGVTSCQAVRTIENKSEFYKKGDTAVMITTKTVESYNASKNK